MQVANTTSSILPACALECFSSALLDSDCAATNSTCICTDQVLNTRVSLCVTSTCTVKEALVAQNVSASSCNVPVRDFSHDFDAVTIVFGTLAIIAVTLRLISGTRVRKVLGPDDALVVAILLTNVALCAINIWGLSANGFAKDIWTLTPGQVTNVLRFSYIVSLGYYACISLTKISICLFYLRIFPSETVQKLIYGTIALNVLSGLAFALANAFQCSPIDFYWNGWDGEHAGHCILIDPVVNAQSGVNIALDVWMLALPASQVIHLNMPGAKKAQIAFMFGLGIFVTAVTIVRLVVLVHTPYSTSTNPTMDFYVTALWSQIEISVGIVCTCFPSIRSLLLKIFEKPSSPGSSLPGSRPVGSIQRGYGERLPSSDSDGIYSIREDLDRDSLWLIERGPAG